MESPRNSPPFRPGRGGRRPGAGAPLGNRNAQTHGLRGMDAIAESRVHLGRLRKTEAAIRALQSELKALLRD